MTMLDKISVVIALVVKLTEKDFRHIIQEYEYTCTEDEALDNLIYQIGFEADCELIVTDIATTIRGKTEKSINACIDKLYHYFDNVEMISADSIITAISWGE